MTKNYSKTIKKVITKAIIKVRAGSIAKFVLAKKLLGKKLVGIKIATKKSLAKKPVKAKRPIKRRK